MTPRHKQAMKRTVQVFINQMPRYCELVSLDAIVLENIFRELRVDYLELERLVAKYRDGVVGLTSDNSQWTADVLKQILDALACGSSVSVTIDNII